MKSLRNGLFTLGLFLFSSLSAAAQSPESAPTSATPEIPVYEQLGISSTTLFMIMMGVTLLLVAIIMTLGGVIKRLIEAEKDKLSKAAKILIIGFGLFYSSPSFAAGETAGESLINFPNSTLWLFVSLDIVLILVIFYFRSIINSFMPEGIKKESLLPWSKLTRSLTGKVVEVEMEGSILMDHEYDGIHELDNDLPPWWKYGFYVTIVWAVVYFGYFQVFGVGLSQEEEFIAEMEQAEKDIEAYKAAHPELINADNVELLTDASALSQGKEIFGTYCVSCHVEGGVGGIGPNLTDKYWIYDGDIKGVFTSISEGRQNGMVAWKEFIGPDQIQKVASYVLSLDEVNAPQGKEPQGENIFE